MYLPVPLFLCFSDSRCYFSCRFFHAGIYITLRFSFMCILSICDTLQIRRQAKPYAFLIFFFWADAECVISVEFTHEETEFKYYIISGDQVFLILNLFWAIQIYQIIRCEQEYGISMALIYTQVKK